MLDQKGPLFYVLHATGIFAAIGSGIIAIARGKFSRLTGPAAMAAVILCGTTLVWAVITYSQEEFLSMKIFGGTGPFVWLTLIIVFAGMDAAAWSLIHPTIEFIAYATAILAVHAMVTAQSYVHWATFSKYLQYTIILAWCGGWTLLNATRKRGLGRWIRAVPFVVLILTAIYAQGRSWVIISALLATIFALGVPARGRGPGVGKRTLVAIIFLPAACAIVFVAVSSLMPRAVDRFATRLSDDTRTQQYVAFFSDVQWHELMLGRGPAGTWYWDGDVNYQYIDNGYLWMAFIGGLPVLITYCILILLPAVRALWSGAPLNIAPAAWILVLWALALGGLGTFVNPSLNLQSYLMSLLAGRCHAWLGESERMHQLYRLNASARRY